MIMLNPEYIHDGVIQSFMGSGGWNDVVFAVKVEGRKYLVRQRSDGYHLGTGYYSSNYWEPRKKSTMTEVILYFARTPFGNPETRNLHIEYLMSLEEPKQYNTLPLTISKERIAPIVYTTDPLITAAFEVALEAPAKTIYLSYLRVNLRYVLEVNHRNHQETLHNYHIDTIQNKFRDDPAVGPLLKTFHLLNGGV